MNPPVFDRFVRVDYNGRMAQAYDLGRSLSNTTLTVWMDAAAGYVPIGHQPILDLGAGTGRFSASLAQRFGGPVIALEPAAAMRARAAAHDGQVKDGQGKVAHLAGSAPEIPLRSASLRAVWASQVLHHVDDLRGVGAELNRVLAPGGRLLVRGMYTNLPEQWPLVRFFPGLVRVGATRFPTWSAIRGGLESGGLALIAAERVEQVIAGGLVELYQRTRHRADSGLELLDDEEFDQGLSNLAEAATRQGPAPVSERLDLLVFAATRSGAGTGTVAPSLTGTDHGPATPI